MVYWIGLCRTGIGEIFRERGYESITKCRRYALGILSKGGYDWIAIHTNKDTRYHIETIEKSKGGYTVFKYVRSRKRFVEYKLNNDGTLGKEM